MQLFHVRLNDNIKSLTVDELVLRRKTLHLASLNNLLEETKRDLQDFSRKALGMGGASRRGGCAELEDCLRRFEKSVFTEFETVLKQHEALPGRWFNEELHYKRALVEAVDMKRYCTLKIHEATVRCLKPPSHGPAASEGETDALIPQGRKLYSTSCKEDFTQRLARLRSRFEQESGRASSAVPQTPQGSHVSGQPELESAVVKIQSLVRGSSVRSRSMQDLVRADGSEVRSGICDGAGGGGEGKPVKKRSNVQEVALELARVEGFFGDEDVIDEASRLEGTQHLLDACLFGHEDKVSLLATTGEVDLNATDTATGRSALSLAAAVGSVPCLRVLLQGGARLSSLDTRDGSLPLHQACKFGHTNVIGEMYAHVGAASGGARGFIDLLSSQNRYGYGPLHAAGMTCEGGRKRGKGWKTERRGGRAGRGGGRW